ncbi:hypothetical protein ACYSNR_18590 [Enterococcus sp. LJL128]
MKSLHYAFADLHYYKKSTLSSIVYGSFFLVFLTVLLNMLDINRIWTKELLTLSPDKETIAASLNWNTIYLLIYVIAALLYTAAAGIMAYREIAQRKAVIQKWRLLGFSDFYIIKQSLLETILVLISVLLISSMFLLVFQNSYESLLLKIHSLVGTTDFRLSIHALQDVDNVPATTSSSIYESVGVFAVNHHSLSLTTIFKRLLQNTVLLTLISSNCALIFTILGTRQSKLFLRK